MASGIRTDREIGWGVLGGGRVVEAKSGPGFLIPGKSRVVAAARRGIEDAERTAKALGASHAVTTVTELVSDPQVDAVYIATPPGLHFHAALTCLDAGKPVYVEKPFVTNTRDAKDLVDRFDSSGVQLFAAYYRRALPKFQRIKQLVASEIGDVVAFDFHLNRRLLDDIEHPWMFDLPLSGGGKFADIAPHSIDLMVYFFGEAVDVWADARHLRAPNGREDMVVMGMRFSSGVSGTLNYNFLSPHKSDLMSIYGTRANVHFSVHGDSVTEVEWQDGTRKKLELTTPQCIEAPMIEEVVKALRGEGGSPCLGAEAIETVRIMEFALGTLR